MDGIQVRVWKGLGNKDSSNEEWEEHFRVLARQQTQGLDFAIDMRVMVVDAFQQTNDPMVLENRALDIVEKTFRVADGLYEGGNEGEPNGDVKAPFDNEGQQ